MKFDPIRVREVSDNAVRRALSTEFDESRPMGNVAASTLGEVVRAWLVGYAQQIAPVTARANHWLDVAISRDEKFGVDANFHRMTLHWARAMGEWLETAWNAEGHWDAARVFEEAAWRFEPRPWPANEIINVGLDDYMAFAYQGGEHNDGFQAGVDMFERWLRPQKMVLTKTLKPREFGYALCLYRASQQFDAQDLFEAGKNMLRANLESNWLGAGQYLRAAMWLKSVYDFTEEKLTPIEVVLKAYDHMSNVPKPNFIEI